MQSYTENIYGIFGQPYVFVTHPGVWCPARHVGPSLANPSSSIMTCGIMTSIVISIHVVSA